MLMLYVREGLRVQDVVSSEADCVSAGVTARLSDEGVEHDCC